MIKGRGGPAWLSVLLAAQEWGCPPWEIAEDESRVKWYFRWLKYCEAKAQVQELKRG